MRFFLVALFSTVSSLATDGQQPDVVQIGQPLATTVQLPTFGVAIDAEGALKVKTFVDPGRQLLAQRAAAMREAARRAAGRGDVARPSELRKVSLVRLQTAIAQRQQQGKMSTEAMSKLAGLTRVTAAFCYPDSGEIVIAGPAEPWIQDPSGRTIGIVSGRPTLLLDDLVVALRTYPSDTDTRAFVGCTINPRAEGLAKLVRFQRSIPRSVPQHQRSAVAHQIATGVKQSLGDAEIRVFGVSSQTHFARVMIEADYRMKRIAVGIEPPPVRLSTYASALTSAGVGNLQRWWFTPDYQGLLASPDRLAMQLSGQGVRLQTEDKSIRDDGSIAGRMKPSRASQVFASSFTRQYEQIAGASPVYAQLRQLTDWLILAAYMREFQWYQRAGWKADLLLDESVISVNRFTEPRSAEVVVNAFWKQNRMFAPAGGGVSIEAHLALDSLAETDIEIEQAIEANRAPDDTRWWWD